MNRLLDFDIKEKKVYYLGYLLKLTRAEYDILSYLDENEKASAEEIVSKVFKEKQISTGNVAVHICNINKKARVIGGRSIIVSDYGNGYRIGKFI